MHCAPPAIRYPDEGGMAVAGRGFGILPLASGLATREVAQTGQRPGCPMPGP